jgi:hypothetical protein|tara:strand:+ start:1451 stop:2062 length:612 start_codon:yes stop_codon:yes gene_type:complete
MATYNLHYTGGMAQTQYVYFYENITSVIDTSLISGKFLLFYIRGRKTNWIRSIAAYPTDSGDYGNPTWLNNSRYWTLRLTANYPTASNISNYDTTNNLAKRQGAFVPPINETYDIDLYYTSQNYLNVLRTDLATKIDGISIVLNVSVDKVFLSEHSQDLPISYYTEYANNDLIGATVPLEGYSDSNNRDSQYGTQNWQPTYDS